MNHLYYTDILLILCGFFYTCLFTIEVLNHVIYISILFIYSIVILFSIVYKIIKDFIVELQFSYSSITLWYLGYRCIEIIYYLLYILPIIRLCMAFITLFFLSDSLMIGFLIHYSILEEFDHVDIREKDVISDLIYYIGSRPTSFLDTVLNREPSPERGPPRPPENNNPVHARDDDRDEEESLSNRPLRGQGGANPYYDPSKPWSLSNTHSEVFRTTSPTPPPVILPTEDEVRDKGWDILDKTKSEQGKVSAVKMTSLSHTEREVLRDAYNRSMNRDLLTDAQKKSLAIGRYGSVPLEGVLKSTYGIKDPRK